jgi:hypothetical protein
VHHPVAKSLCPDPPSGSTGKTICLVSQQDCLGRQVEQDDAETGVGEHLDVKQLLHLGHHVDLTG